MCSKRQTHLAENGNNAIPGSRCDEKQKTVKVLKKPRFDLSKLLELHGDAKGSGEVGEGGKVDRPEGYEPPVQETRQP
ncbi:hypothetical protein B566_EDAN006049 [Ephemera danica]|nr:hypothetical protein B566_EDAN006049 [Ephemera danica]